MTADPFVHLAGAWDAWDTACSLRTKKKGRSPLAPSREVCVALQDALDAAAPLVELTAAELRAAITERRRARDSVAAAVARFAPHRDL